jgi:hypothetical protein
MALLWLTSSILYLVSCSTNSTSIPLGLRQVECAKGHVGVQSGPNHVVWDVVVAFSMVSTVLYIIHAGMAAYVRVVVKREKMEKKRNPDVRLTVVDPDVAQLARERWEALGRYEL